MSELKKSISLWQGTALAVSMVVGSGLLGLPGLALQAGSPRDAAFGWLLTIIAAIPLIAIFARLGRRFASSAGLSRYAEEALGSWGSYAVTAVLSGTFTIGIPALALIGAAYAGSILQAPGSVPWIAAGMLVLSTGFNVLGVRLANWVNTVAVVALMGLVVFIVFFNLSDLAAGADLLVSVPDTSLSYPTLWGIAALLFWAFLGWENLSFGLEEFEEAERNIPRVYWFSFALVAVLYFALALTSVGAQATGVSVEGAAGLTSLLAGTPLQAGVVVVMVLVILANANAWVFGASRLVYSAGRDGILPEALDRVNRDGIPVVSLLTLLGFYIVVIAGMSITGISLSLPILLVSQNFLVLYAITIYAYWRLEGGWRRWVVGPLAVISCGFLLSGFSWWIAYPLGLIALGYVGYRRSAKSKKKVS